MLEEIICAGFGGQGILLMGTLLAHAGMKEGKHVLGIPSYGAEMRGGTANYGLIISDEEIRCPIVFCPTTCIIMNSPSLEKFLPRIKKGGLLLLNSSLVKEGVNRSDIEIIRIPATEIAESLGNIKSANVVILGSYAVKKGVLSLESLLNALKDVLPKHRHHLLETNQEALRKGYSF